MINQTVKKLLPLSLIVPVIATAGCGLPYISDFTATETTTATLTKTVTQEVVKDTTIVTRNDFSEIIKDTKSSVVAITTESSYFSIFGTYTQQGAGSGFVLDENGIIVTNNHVIEGASTVNVIFEDGTTYQAQAIYADEYTDIAVIKINATGLDAVTIGDSEAVLVGNWALVVGNSLGLGISATEGIISAVDVTLSSTDQSVSNLIQTSAAINPGNSGGPLFNTNGEVIGITSSKMSAVGVEGMGYAISINEALPIINELIANGKVNRPDLGIGMYTVSSSIAQRYQLPVSYGVLVTSVENDSIAAAAGIKAGDVIVKINDTQVNTTNELTAVLQKQDMTSSIVISYYHGKNLNNVEVVLSK